MPTPARSATADTGASQPCVAKTSRAASRTLRSLRAASCWRPRVPVTCPPYPLRSDSLRLILTGAKRSDRKAAVMQVIVLSEFGPPAVLVPATADDPVPGPGQVVIAVGFANVTFVETQMRAG